MVTSVLAICTVAWLAHVWVLHRRGVLERQRLNDRTRTILSCVDDVLLVADGTGRIVEANERALELLGWRREELLQRTLAELCIGLPADLLAHPAGSSVVCHVQLRNRENTLLPIGFTITHLACGAGTLVCAIGTAEERRLHLEDQLRATAARLAHLRQHDPLTGLPNRTSLDESLPALLAAHRDANVLGLLHVDIDHFKRVNAARGHGAGDQILQDMARQLRAAIGRDDLLFRVGGDEFVIVVPQLHDVSAVRAKAQRVLHATRSPMSIADATLMLTASVGAVVYPRDGADAATLLKHADIALFRAKEHGRNCVEVFASHMHENLDANLALEQDLLRAIDTDQIYVEYQPLVELQDGVLVSFEALARWRHPQLGPVSPAKFIAVAERSGLIITLGERVLRDVVAQLQRWRDQGVPLAPVAINVAAMQLERTEFPTLVHELCMTHEIDPQWLSFELTESVWVNNSNKHIVAIDTLRHGGSRVAIDDFGTGFSNLSYLRDLPIDAIKIDRSFVTNVATDPSDAAIVSGVVAMAKSRQLVVVAEGVETMEQILKLRELGCHRAQGYYYGKPMSAVHCKALLEQLGEMRKLTETVRVRAFKVAEG
ncbi:MAG TPA: EAL domain-containing protein [Steroidobacteraceae bacterium]|nr:EAL domain-containing protein [Steroidobacteraceae bacterium]